MAEGLAERLKSAGLTVAVAETSSGGLIAARLTGWPGSSVYFRGGIVAYDDRSKTELLGVPASIFERHGSVSAEACLAMAAAASRLFQSDLGVAETSIAGPGGGSARKPVGLSYVAVCGDRQRDVREWRFSGDRNTIRTAIARAALALLEEHVSSRG